MSWLQRLIVEHGATTVVVPGVIPVGCAPPVLATFADPDPAGYDPRTGCLKAINEVAAHHNALLQDALRELRARHRHRVSAVIYADFFGPVIDMVTSPAKFGEHTCTVLACHESRSRHASPVAMKRGALAAVLQKLKLHLHACMRAW
jgi:phospholipase/lecithinase/hemolysin